MCADTVRTPVDVFFAFFEQAHGRVAHKSAPCCPPQATFLGVRSFPMPRLPVQPAQERSNCHVCLSGSASLDHARLAPRNARYFEETGGQISRIGGPGRRLVRSPDRNQWQATAKTQATLNHRPGSNPIAASPRIGDWPRVEADVLTIHSLDARRAGCWSRMLRTPPRQRA